MGLNLKFKKLAFQQNKFQLIWTSFTYPIQPINPNYPNYPVKPECTQFWVCDFLSFIMV